MRGNFGVKGFSFQLILYPVFVDVAYLLASHTTLTVILINTCVPERIEALKPRKDVF